MSEGEERLGEDFADRGISADERMLRSRVSRTAWLARWRAEAAERALADEKGADPP
jgi:hypothetical protein